MKNKKMMIACPLSYGTTKNGRDIAAELSRSGYKVSLFDTDKRCLSLDIIPKPLRNAQHVRRCADYLNQALLKAISQSPVDVLFIVKPVNIYAETLALINAMGVITCCYWIDDPRDFPRAIKNSHCFSLCFTNDKNTVEKYRAEGVNAHYLPSAVDSEAFRPLNASKRYPVSFIGTCADYRKEILNKIEHQVNVFGPGWKKQCSRADPLLPRKPVFGSKTCQVYNQSIINLNIHMWHGIGSAMNLRLFEVPACQAFLLTDWVDEIDEHFTPGVNIEVWRDTDELNDKIRFYIAHDAAREKITQASFDHVRRHHTYNNRCQMIMQHLKQYV